MKTLSRTGSWSMNIRFANTVEVNVPARMRVDVILIPCLWSYWIQMNS